MLVAEARALADATVVRACGLRRKSARRGAGSVEPGTQVLEGSPAPQSAVTPHGTPHAVRQRAARQQLWPVSRRVTP